MTVAEIHERIRAVVDEHAGLDCDVAALDVSADLYEAGMTSRATVNIMLAVEGTFDIEFPDEMLQREVFASIAAIGGAVARISEQVS